MSQKIKGITISLEGDSTPLQKALKDVDKASSKTTKELGQINRALKFDEGNTVLLEQKFEVLQEVINQTATKFDVLKQAQSEVEKQFESGEIDATTFREFQREIEKTEGKLKAFRAQADDIKVRINTDIDTSGIAKMENELEGLADTAERTGKEIGQSLIAGAAAGIGAGAVIQKALSEDELKTKIDITFDVPKESKDSVRQAVADVQAYGIDGESALEGMRRQWALNKNATDQANASIVQGAAAISKSYAGIDFVELIQESNEIGKELKISNEAALDLVNSLLQVGFPPEQLDIIAEYGSQLQRVGYTAEEVQGLITAAVNTGTFNVDNLLDGIKEGRIRAAEMGAGLSTTMKDALKEVVGTTKEMTDEQLRAMENGFSKQEDALEKSLGKRLDSLEDSYDQQQRDLDKSLDDEYRAFEKASDRRIALIDKEYMEKMKLVDEERYNQIKAIEDQIKGLDELTAAEDRAAKERENAEDRAELEKKIRRAKTKHDRQKAEEELQAFEEKLRLEALREERKDEIEALKNQKDNVNELFAEKKDSLKTEYDLKKDRISEEIELDKQALRERQDLDREALAKRRQDHLESVAETNTHELEAFRQMNEEKLRIAENPPDSAAYKAIESQLVNWGKAIAKGDEAGTKAFAEMTKWLNGIEDETLQNSIATELFGVQWEDQGENIIETLSGMNAAMEENKKKTGEAKSVVDGWDASAVKNVSQSMQDLQKNLGPVLDSIAKIVDVIASFMNAHPKLTAALTIIIGVLGLLSAAIMAVAPAIGSVMLAFPGLLGIFGKLGPLISGIVKFLPLLGRGFLALLGPIGVFIAIVTTVIGLAKLIIKNWEPISGFFKNLWDGVLKTIEKVIKAFIGLKDNIGNVFQGLVGIIKTPINMIITLINGFIAGINKIKIPDWVPGDWGGKGMEIPMIPMLAKGTDYFKGGMAVVGEQGPELVEMPTGAKVHTAAETAGMLGGAGVLEVPVTLTLDGRVLAQQTVKYNARELYNYQQTKRRGQ